MGSILNMTGAARASPLLLPPPSGLFMVTNPNTAMMTFVSIFLLFNARNRPHLRTNYLADALPGCRQPQRKIPSLSKSSHFTPLPASPRGKASISTIEKVLQFQLWALVSVCWFWMARGTIILNSIIIFSPES